MSLELSKLFFFPLDDFQVEAIEHLARGESVVVCAPTGSGKTVIAEYAVEMALEQNRRCYYTTPLKALSNQKFSDFKKKYGDDKVGLLTGDISINRDAPVVVMTTEVFRNMLYGTHLGAVDKNLAQVSHVVLDECHYMNDAERGTVWEESIIYCPPGIQLVALSATVANAQELTDWIDQTHGPTKLVLSTFRPVPLHFYYFAGAKLFHLYNTGGGLNGQIKSLFARKHDRFAGKRPRGKMEALPDPRDVLRDLASKDMLPAIYFLFSRRGCEELMKKANDINLLSIAETRNLAKEVDALIQVNDNLRTHPHLPYIYKGIAVHHAGMLPSWKVLVEKLFQKGLIKAVFATETLAAGINMPARTTVISAISKRSDEGHRMLRASEFLQMSGRAGRRGMDEIGHVVVLRHPFEHVEDVAKLASAPPDALSSRFTPSYGMVLNLLQRHSGAESRELIERSFGQFVINRELEPLYEQKMTIESELEHLSKPLCPDEIGDLPAYRRLVEAQNTKARQIKLIRRGGQGVSDPAMDRAVLDLQREVDAVVRSAHAMPCHRCPVQKPCSKQGERVRTLTNRLKETDRRISAETIKYWKGFESLSNILRMQGYLNADTVTDLGKMAASIRATNELFISEVIISGLLNDLTVPEFAAVLTALVTDAQSRPDDVSSARTSPGVEVVLDKVNKLARKVFMLQRDFGIEIPVETSPLFCGLTQMWVEGASWEQIRLATYFDEGIVVRALRRTVDLCRQIAIAPKVPANIAQKAIDAERLLARDEVREDY
ncbi:MAG: DEAD/DEAH box helicase [Candidatus Obscuribacterales bacterium]|nr:DEAD/DEAH box helicase [Candidatus Obscuribacterales bacterium]